MSNISMDSALSKVIFLFFRRMRTPLIVLICAYAVSIIGLVLIPGVDETGNPWRFDFFHAFYFVSFLASTIGLGEIPTNSMARNACGCRSVSGSQ